METQTLISVDLIKPNPYQPRQVEDQATVAEIAASIKRNGLMQVPAARRVNGHFELAFGHTRLAAFKFLKEACMPLIVRELSDLQMFELGVSENIKRRDLNPIELAEAMRRYMQEFKKNSIETGQFFNVTPEKVRSAIRLLNLPKNLQAGVADGSITQTNARRLLTIQRVAPDQVKEVAKELKSDVVDPDAVIANALKNNGNSVEMWPSWRRDEEPMAGSHLWPLRLPAEKFPRAHLPEMTVTQAAKIVGGDWSSPHDKGVMQNYIRHFMNGGTVDDMPGAPHEDGKYDRLAHLINPPSCTTCPFYAKVNGAHFCTFKECYSRKSKAWQANELDEAVQKLNIAQYDPKVDGQFVILNSYTETHTKLVNASSPDLRLKKGNTFSNFDDVPDGFVIVAVGKSAEKLMPKEGATERAASSPDEYLVEQRRLAAMRNAHSAAVYEFLWNVATPAFECVLNGVSSLDFLNQLADRMVRGVPEEEPGTKATKAAKLSFYRRALLFSLMDDDLWDICQKKHPVTAMAKRLQGVANTWDVKLPKDWLEVAAEADKAIKVPTEAQAEPI